MVNTNFVWDDKTIKLLLAEYNNRIKEFRDPKKKKLLLWREIKVIFNEHGYNVGENIIERKMRNMKHHYKQIIDNNKKSRTGRGKITWEYFDIFNEIFAEDKTIFPGPVLSSMSSAPSSYSIPNSSSSPLTSNVTHSPSLIVQPPFHTPTLPLETIQSFTNTGNIENCTPNSKRRKVEKKDLEERKVLALEGLRVAVEKYNEIQQERNNLIKKIYKIE